MPSDDLPVRERAGATAKREEGKCGAFMGEPFDDLPVREASGRYNIASRILTK